jgi:hypothetical protein
MSDTFWLVFWGVIAAFLGAGVALLIKAAWWIGAIVGVAIYLVVLLFGGSNGTFIYIDLD